MHPERIARRGKHEAPARYGLGGRLCSTPDALPPGIITLQCLMNRRSAMTKFGEWEVIGPLGSGGQSEVHIVRTPKRVRERQSCLPSIRIHSGGDNGAALAEAIYKYARPDTPDELGALKHFSKIPTKRSLLPKPPNADESEAINRLKNEISALSQTRPGLPRLLDSSEDERWIVTELFTDGTLERHILKFKGKALAAFRAFRGLVETVRSLHKDGYIHRDIKPANVFLRNDGELVLGDFGIVYLPINAERLTQTQERVGPRDYMPPWGDLGERLEEVRPNFDVYMLGKLLWCMVAGRMKLPREYHRRDQFNVARLFPDDRNMSYINRVLDNCVVERPEACLQSAEDLLELIDEILTTLEKGTPMLDDSGALVLPCRVCGKGFYLEEGREVRLQTFDSRNMPQNSVHLRLFVCNVCTHREFFAPGHPNEAATKKWKPWRD